MQMPPCVDDTTDKVIVSPSGDIMGSIDLETNTAVFCGENGTIVKMCEQVSEAYSSDTDSDEFVDDVSDLVGLFSHQVENVGAVNSEGEVVDEEMEQIIGLY